MERIEMTGRQVLENLRQMFEDGDLESRNFSQCPNCLDTGFERVRYCQPNGKWYEGVIKAVHCCNYWSRRLQNDIGQGRKQL